MFLRFSSHITMSLMPARFAARIFSLMPPTGSTFPRNVISPVIARFGRTLRWVNAEAMEVAMVIPADGPSLGTAPSGTCTWIFHRSKIRASICKWSACALIYSNAKTADSFITSPKFPVSVNLLPFPLLRLVSIKRISPPTEVHANPVTTPA